MNAHHAETEVDAQLPWYRRPPLVETVISVQFKPLAFLTNAHLGVFWDRIRQEFPTVRELHPIPSMPDWATGGPAVWEKLRPTIRFSNSVACRLQLVNLNDDLMVQIQRDRIALNWRRGTGEADAYPRYRQLLPKFLEIWERWTSYVEGWPSARFEPEFWEMVYINHIPAGDIWRTPKDWPRVFSPLLCPFRCPSTGVEPEGFNGTWVYRLGADGGRLIVEIEPRRAAGQEQPLLVYRLTACGKVTLNDTRLTLEHDLESRHRVIVEAFTALTDPVAHDAWGKTV